MSDVASGPASNDLVKVPTPWLDDEAYAYLNQRFYATEPHEYFARRLELLALAAGKPGVVARELAEGVEYDGLNWAVDRGEERPDEFIVSESVAIFHHVAETLLRHYLAHENDPRCPWIAIAELRRPRDFKSRLEERFTGAPLDKARRRQLARVFYGHPEQTADGLTRERWNDGLDDLERWLVYFARTILDDAQLYNSHKHGLTVGPGSAYLSIGMPGRAESEPPLLEASGPSIAFLALDAKLGWPNLWHERTHWIRPDALIAESWWANRMLESIWRIGRSRYVEGGDLGDSITFFEPCFDELARSRRDRSSCGTHRRVRRG